MAHLTRLPHDATLLDVFKAYPHTGALANALAQHILRGPGVLSPAQRELLFAYGSGLNACHFCHGSHTAVAVQLGVAPGVIESALDDIATAPVDENFKPLLRYVKKLTETPARVSPSDAEAVRAAGWSDDALHEAILVCALHNFFNRWVDGTGVDADETFFAAVGQRLTEVGYDRVAETL